MTSRCEDGEGVLDEHSHFLDAEEDGRVDDGDRDGEPVEGVPEREGEEEVVQDQEAGGEAGVGERDGGLEQPLAAAHVIGEGREVLLLQREREKKGQKVELLEYCRSQFPRKTAWGLLLSSPLKAPFIPQLHSSYLSHVSLFYPPGFSLPLASAPAKFLHKAFKCTVGVLHERTGPA